MGWQKRLVSFIKYYHIYYHQPLPLYLHRSSAIPPVTVICEADDMIIFPNFNIGQMLLSTSKCLVHKHLVCVLCVLYAFMMFLCAAH